MKTFVWTYHFMEEIEHTHISVPEMRESLSLIEKVAAWLVFDLFVAIPIVLIIVPITTIKHFPSRVFSFQGIQEMVEYFVFGIIALLLGAAGQFAEMILELNWKADALQDLWDTTYNTHYKRDCFEDGEEMFDYKDPHKAPLTPEARDKKLNKKGSLLSISRLGSSMLDLLNNDRRVRKN